MSSAARRTAELIVVVLSIGALVGAASSIRPDGLLVGGLLVVAMAWGVVPFAIVSVLRSPSRSRSADTHISTSTGSPATVTTVVHIGYEPAQVARTSVIAAASAGPTIVVATDPDVVGILDGVDVAIFTAATVGEALVAGVQAIATDAVLVVSADCFPDSAAAASAAGLLGDGVGWVTGRIQPFNRNGCAPTERECLDQRVRGMVRLNGAIVWEPNATLVSTALLRNVTAEPGRPWGSWLRAWQTQGHRGIETEATLAVWSVPVTPDWYWRRSVLRRRGAVADLADGAATGHGADRWLSNALQMRELYALPLIIWLLSPLLLSLTDTFPFHWSPWILFSVAGTSGLLRWLTTHLVHQVPLHPVREALAAAYDVPSSVLAVPATFTRRVHSTRFNLPNQLHVWAILLFASAMVVSLLNQRGSPSRNTVAALVLAELGLLWMFGMYAIEQRLWRRTVYSVPLTLAVDVADSRFVAVGASPAAITLRGNCAELTTGSTTMVAIHLDDGTVLRARAHITRIRPNSDDPRLDPNDLDPKDPDAKDLDAVDIDLDVPEADRARWVVQLSNAALNSARQNPRQMRRATGGRPHHALPRPAQLLAGAVTAMVAAVSVVVSAVLVLLFLGYHPMVVRSGSMAPTLRTGDIVLVRHTTADQLDPGEIATFPGVGTDAGTNESVTHRVIAVSQHEEMLVFETRGDANASSETWSIPANGEVGRVEHRVPKLGTLVSWLGSGRVRTTVVPSLLGFAALAVIWPAVSNRRQRMSRLSTSRLPDTKS